MKGKIWFFIGVVIFVLVTVIVLFRYNSSQGIKNVKNNIQEEGNIFIDLNRFHNKSIHEVEEILISELPNVVMEESFITASGEYNYLEYYTLFADFPEGYAKKYESDNFRFEFVYDKLPNGDERLGLVRLFCRYRKAANHNIEYIFNSFNLDSSKYMEHKYYNRHFVGENQKIDYINLHTGLSYLGESQDIDYINPKKSVFAGIAMIEFRYNYDVKKFDVNKNHNLKVYTRTEADKRKVDKLDNIIDINKIMTMDIEEYHLYATDNNWIPLTSRENRYLVIDIPSNIVDKYVFNALEVDIEYDNSEVFSITIAPVFIRGSLNDYSYSKSQADFRVDAHEDVLDMFNIEYVQNKAYKMYWSNNTIYKYINKNIGTVEMGDLDFGIKVLRVEK